MRLIKNAVEYLPIHQVYVFPESIRGLYVLYKCKGLNNNTSYHYDVVYIGMTCKNIKSRLLSHRNSKHGLWSHFSAFEVWDNITEGEIKELEGLFRQLYRYDSNPDTLNVQKSYQPLVNLVKKKWL